MTRAKFSLPALAVLLLGALLGLFLLDADDAIWPACSWKLRPAWATAGATTVVFGDSHVCPADLDGEYPQLDLAWRGMEGATTAQLDERLGQALAAHPRDVMLIAGTNDVVQGRTAEQFAADYGRLVSRLPEGSLLALVTIPPCTANVCADPVQQARLKAINREIARVARSRGAFLVDLHAATATPDGAWRPGMTRDGIHLSQQGYRRFHALAAPWFAQAAVPRAVFR